MVFSRGLGDVYGCWWDILVFGVRLRSTDCVIKYISLEGCTYVVERGFCALINMRGMKCIERSNAGFVVMRVVRVDVIGMHAY
jgi:hypothetical protein